MRSDGERAGADRERLETLYRAAVAAADPRRLVRAALRADESGVVLEAGGGAHSVPQRGLGSVRLVGGGKAAPAMVGAALEILGGRVASGAVAVPHGTAGTIGPVVPVPAGHPVPDEGSLQAGRAIVACLRGAGPRDLVIALLSGGGSAMIAAPARGVSLADKAAVSESLLRAGAEIGEFNAVRKHLSRVKGGLLARAARPARVLALLLSDVPGDDPSVIASGPFSPDPSTYADARAALSRHGLLAGAPPSVRRRLLAGTRGLARETPKPGARLFEGVSCAVVGANATAIGAAASEARKLYRADAILLPGFLRGDAGDCAASFVAEMRRVAATPGGAGELFLIAGGETTVRVGGGGAGGRSQEFALAAAIAMAGSEGMSLLAAGTDGIDGPTDAAGAFADGRSCARAAARGLDPRAHLDDNDSNGFFRALGDLVVTGPTGTNVGDVAFGIVRRHRQTD